MQHAAISSAPDLSASRAIKNAALLIPSAFASALGLFTFGTTSHFRDTMYKTFVPKRWQKPTTIHENTAIRSTSSHSPSPTPSVIEASTDHHHDGNNGNASRNVDTDVTDTNIVNDSVLGQRFSNRGSWLAGVRTSVSSAIPLNALSGSESIESPRSPESTVARSSGIRSVYELDGVFV